VIEGWSSILFRSLLSFVDTTSKTEFINNILEKVRGIEKPDKLTKGKIPCHSWRSIWGLYDEIFMKKYFIHLSEEKFNDITTIVKNFHLMIRHYYAPFSFRNTLSIFRLYVLTYQHCQLVKALFPTSIVKNRGMYQTYYHLMEIHLPELYRIYTLLDLTSEREESDWKFDKVILQKCNTSIENASMFKGSGDE
jgi:hypothetical protein